MKLEFLSSLNEKTIDMSKEFQDGYQKDWIVYNKDFTKLFCIAVIKKNSKYILHEFVNIFDDPEKVFKTLNMGYMTMLEAASNRSEYKYVIANHSFSKKDIDIEYWNNLVSNNKFWNKETINKEIDGDEFEAEMGKLVKNKDIHFKNFN